MLFSTSRLKSCPQGLKPIVLASFMYELKPVPFIDSVFPQPVKPVPFEPVRFSAACSGRYAHALKSNTFSAARKARRILNHLRHD
jgi:hypothetical protein